MKCGECRRTFVNPKKFALHLEIFHQKTNFMCPEKNCRRLFSRRDAFVKHLTSKHINKFPSTSSVKPHVRDTHTIPTASVLPQNAQAAHQDNFNNIEDERTVSSDSLDTLVSKFCSLIDSEIRKFISQLYDKLTITKSCIQNIIQFVNAFLSSGVLDLLQKCCEVANGNTLPSQISNMFKLLKNPFLHLDTEHKRFKYFLQSNYLIEPFEQVLGLSGTRSAKKDIVSLVLKDRSFCYIPLKKTLKLFLELPKVFDEIVTYQGNICKRSAYCNILNGSLHKDFFNNVDNKIVLPLILYYDDFETSNPLGSHAGVHKLGVIYCSVATTPPQYSSRLENIFLTMIFYSTDRFHYGNKALFTTLVHEVNYLATEGINLSLEDREYKVFFKLVAVVGDNLGMNSIFGFVESFTAHYYCRICYCKKNVAQTQTVEDKNFLRNKIEYLNHVDGLHFGLKEKCIFNDVHDFHVYSHSVCDIMHDLFEGVHRYTMAKIINTLVSQNFFTLTLLNSRIRHPTHDTSDKNIPPPIKDE
ncbi:uncharacterized protein LOC116168774, partial [Photinus pyralis]|uniref:uncharacterized protein LOC116168774 n=1 Tax=Photinus pyralis TaxID=7054 RepID=UPI00126757EF